MEFSLYDKFYLYNNQGKSMTAELVYSLDQNIDGEALKKAVGQALDIFITWKVKPLLDENGRVVFEENNGTVPVFEEDDEKISLGSASTNGYLFRVLYKNSVIKLSAFHVLGDGNVMSLFMMHVLYYYLTNLGISIDSEKMIYDNTPATALEDVVTKAKEYISSVSSDDAPKDEEAKKYYIEDFDMPYFMTDKSYTIDIEFVYSQLASYLKENNATLTVMLIDLIAKSMIDVYKIEDDLDLKICIAADLRKSFNSESFHNFAADVQIEYDNEIKGASLQDRFSILKNRIKNGMDLEKLSNHVVENVETIKVIEQYLRLDQYEAIKAIMVKGQKANLVSFYVSSMGVLKFPKDMMEHIDVISMCGNPVKPETNYYIYTYNDKCVIRIRQNHDQKDIALNVCGYLNELGVDAKCIDIGLESYDYVDPDQFSRMNN
ncbi:MAG: hypothetical protein MJZ11_04640 [Lachnospiraceae bacterium]|nr:hypothetical protein [Lachnospiraceae bacterium]